MVKALAVLTARSSVLPSLRLPYNRTAFRTSICRPDLPKRIVPSRASSGSAGAVCSPEDRVTASSPYLNRDCCNQLPCTEYYVCLQSLSETQAKIWIQWGGGMETRVYVSCSMHSPTQSTVDKGFCQHDLEMGYLQDAAVTEVVLPPSTSEEDLQAEREWVAQQLQVRLRPPARLA